MSERSLGRGWSAGLQPVPPWAGDGGTPRQDVYLGRPGAGVQRAGGAHQDVRRPGEYPLERVEGYWLSVMLLV